MPRTIDGILNAHRAARELREKRKPIWSRKIKIKDLLGDDDSNENSVAVAHEIAKRFRAEMPNSTFDVRENEYDDEITSLIEDLESFNLQMDQEICEVLNERIDEIYDWADVKRVWIG